MKVTCKNCQASVINGTPCHEQGCSGFFTFTDEDGREFIRFQVWSLDVWGNEDEGFEVNDRSRACKIDLPSDADGKAVIQALKKAGLLNPRCNTKTFDVEWMDESTAYVNLTKTEEPLFQLEAM